MVSSSLNEMQMPHALMTPGPLHVQEIQNLVFDHSSLYSTYTKKKKLVFQLGKILGSKRTVGLIVQLIAELLPKSERTEIISCLYRCERTEILSFLYRFCTVL